DKIVQYVNRIEDELHIPVKEETNLKQTGMLKIIGRDVDNAYQEQLQSIILDSDMLQQTAEKLRIIYTPLHGTGNTPRSEEHTSELQSRFDLVCRLLLEKKKKR